jgi:tetratricopeptide (TPR) repeat protein
MRLHVSGMPPTSSQLGTGIRIVSYVLPLPIAMDTQPPEEGRERYRQPKRLLCHRPARGDVRISGVVAALGCFALLANADPRLAVGGQVDDAESARQHARRATAAYNLGNYGEAAGEFEEAYRLVQDPPLLFNVGQSYRLAGELRRALTGYKSYLRTAPPDGPDRQQAQKWRQDLERRLGEQPSAALLPPAPLAGPAAAASAKPSDATNAIRPPALPVQTAVEVTVSPDRSEARPPLYARWWVWAIVGVALAGVGTAVILGRDTRNSDCLGITPCGSVR